MVARGHAGQLTPHGVTAVIRIIKRVGTEGVKEPQIGFRGRGTNGSFLYENILV